MINYWKDVVSLLIEALGLVIIGFYMHRKIGSLQQHIASLKGQVEAQKGILDLTKNYFSLIDIEQLKGFGEALVLKAKAEADIELIKLKADIEKKELEINNKEIEIIRLNKVEGESQKSQVELLTARQELEDLRNKVDSVANTSAELMPGVFIHYRQLYQIVTNIVDNNPPKTIKESAFYSLVSGTIIKNGLVREFNLPLGIPLLDSVSKFIWGNYLTIKYPQTKNNGSPAGNYWIPENG